MKRELLALIPLILGTSCMIQKSITQNDPGNLESWKLPQYQGFFLSNSKEVNFEFQELGKICSRLAFDFDPMKKGAVTISDHYSSNPDKAIDQLHQKAIDIGANGLIDVHLEYIPTTPPSYFSSGTAIKLNQ